MLSETQRERYLRHILLREVGAQGQHRLLAARALIVGLGGIGSPVLQYLAAAGVGVIGLADDDAVSLSNLQRQTIYATEDIGALKTARAAEAARRINPDVEIRELTMRIGPENAADVVSAFDIVIEGVDNFRTRYALNAAAIAARRPLVSAAIGRFEAQLSVFKPYAAPDLPCYRCFAPDAPEAGAGCAENGVLGPVCGVIGAAAAVEALKEILGIGDSLAGRLFIYSALSGAARTVKISRDPDCPDCRR